MRLVNMNELNEVQLREAAQILRDELPAGWPTLGDAIAEVEERLVPENRMIAVLRADEIVGWGGILAPEYNGNVFELHPLVVKKAMQHKGVGRMLVSALEKEAWRQGGLTIYLGADDEKEGGETSLANIDLYDNLPKHLKYFDPGTHQAGFYLKMGYKILGVLPDANGPGKPDIFFGKRLKGE